MNSFYIDYIDITIVFYILGYVKCTIKYISVSFYFFSVAAFFFFLNVNCLWGLYYILMGQSGLEIRPIYPGIHMLWDEDSFLMTK